MNMKVNRRVTPVAGKITLLLFSLCVLLPITVVFSHNAWNKYLTPDHHVFTIDNLSKLSIQIQPNNDGVEWLGLRWFSDGASIELRNSRMEEYADASLKINAKNGLITEPVNHFEKGQYRAQATTLPALPGENEIPWGGCPQKKILITGVGRLNKWEMHLWQDGQLIANFDSLDSEFINPRYPPGGGRFDGADFSPDCRYLVVNNDGQIWLLDTEARTFEAYYRARKSIFPDFDYPYQAVWPSWSGNGQDVVFGDYIFGIETYNVQTRQRRWLLETDLMAFQPVWSTSGNWIAALRYKENHDQTLLIVSPDGHYLSYLETCQYFEDPVWSPTDDRIAFICHLYDKHSCVDGHCQNERSYLMILVVRQT